MILFCILINLNIHFKELIEGSSIIYKKVFYSICKLESGNFKSKLYLKHNNPAGLKYGKHSYKRNKSGYGYYRKVEDSFIDYHRIELKIIKKYKVKNQEQYLKALVKYKYATDKNYIKKIKKCIE